MIPLYSLTITQDRTRRKEIQEVRFHFGGFALAAAYLIFWFLFTWIALSLL